MSNFYITTTLPYVNAEPHIGFALEIVQADVIARYHHLKGDDVFFNFGTDEHGAKIYEKAVEASVDPQAYCDKYAATFDILKEKLDLSYNNFIRTTDEHHVMAAQEFWKRCEKNGDIYKKEYKAKYCVGCELEKTDSELVDGKCPEHPNRELEIREEENYFFRFSKYQDKLLEFYNKSPDFVVPNFRFNEIKNFVALGLEDFSISRLKSKMPWGVPVPGDEEHVMYVWFDALVNYISAIGWPDRMDEFGAWWPGYQVAGKNNLRQQTAMWQAMLMSAGLPNSKQVLIHGFITLNGQKISKSLGNVISPLELVEKYGIDATRYYLLCGFHPFEDSDFTYQKFEERYTADLVNGLGNLVSRITTLIAKNDLSFALKIRKNIDDETEQSFALYVEVNHKISEYKFNEALEVLWIKLRKCDEVITQSEPWKMTDKQKLKDILEPVAQDILDVAYLLQPFLPETAEKIIKNITAEKIKKSEILFPRLSRE